MSPLFLLLGFSVCAAWGLVDGWQKLTDDKPPDDFISGAPAERWLFGASWAARINGLSRMGFGIVCLVLAFFQLLSVFSG